MRATRGPQVEVVVWNPRRPVRSGRIGRAIPLRRRVNNFGDLLGPLIAEAVLERAGLDSRPARRDARLLTAGSIMHLAREGDVVWGTGVNGKVDAGLHRFKTLDVRAVRGPQTRRFLSSRGVVAPDVYGDPALLLPWLSSSLRRTSQTKAHELTVVPNLNDVKCYEASESLLLPTESVARCLDRIAKSELVVGSSLHAIIVAEAFGVPARLVRSRAEDLFKYADYYEATGRPRFRVAESVDEAVELGGEDPIQWSPDDLLETFPYDLYQA